MIANSFLVPHIEINTNCKDYIIDMTSFILNEKEKEIASKIYSKTFYEFNVIVISRDSNIIGTSFDKINDNSAQKTSLYSLENANESRSLCIKLFKPSIAEQTKFQLPIPFCFITGGMNNYIKIWDAFNGKLLQKVEILSDFAADILLFQLGKNSLHIDEECTTQHNQNKIIKNLVIVGGAPKVIQIIDIEDFSLFQLKIDDHFSINTLELIGAFSNKGKVKKHLLFAIADKGEHLKVWKIKKKGPNLKYICLRRLQLNTYWILGLTSFKHSSDPYKRKYFLATGGMTGNLFQKNMYISLVDWKKSLIIRNIPAHKNWINSLCFLPTKVNGKEILSLVSGGADEKICVWNLASGNLLYENDDRNRIVMHGMKMFAFEKDNQKKIYIVAAGYQPFFPTFIQTFKIWT